MPFGPAVPTVLPGVTLLTGGEDGRVLGAAGVLGTAGVAGLLGGGGVTMLLAAGVAAGRLGTAGAIEGAFGRDVGAFGRGGGALEPAALRPEGAPFGPDGEVLPATERGNKSFGLDTIMLFAEALRRLPRRRRPALSPG